MQPIFCGIDAITDNSIFPFVDSLAMTYFLIDLTFLRTVSPLLPVTILLLSLYKDGIT